jgi:glutamyl-tRNA synthetase
MRVRFAPSPTGPLHIGGVRTALYNYLLAKKHGGSFVLRIEDTDQQRYVPGAEEYIIESLQWLGIPPDESPVHGGDFGPYRQSERKDLYKKYALELIANGLAYYAFDTSEELESARNKDEKAGFKYGPQTRLQMRNSLSLSPVETEELLQTSENTVIRLKMPENETVYFDDVVRERVSFQSSEMDDKVIFKADGMPTYHLANVVDDRLMKITHVIRGEEWLSSTPHHILMYRYFGWEAPTFVHLSLILKPEGKGKLSKRDGAKFGFPVFPMDWQDKDSNEFFPGFKEQGYLPEALLNFLALLGWNPGNDLEIMSLEEMTSMFDLEKIVKSGARFDVDKLKWFNQQYIIHTPDEILAQNIAAYAASKGIDSSDSTLTEICRLMKERVGFMQELIDKSQFFFDLPESYDEVNFNKRYKPENKVHFEKIAQLILQSEKWERDEVESSVKNYINENAVKMGDIFPILRIVLTGTMQGPDLFDTIILLGKEEVAQRILHKIPESDA